MNPKTKNINPPVSKTKNAFISNILYSGKFPNKKELNIEEYKPIKIDKPPSLTVGELCSFRISGKSRKPFFFEIVIRGGIEK